MECQKCGAENPEQVEFCTKCASRSAETEQQAEGEPLTLLGAAPGMILLYFLGFALIFNNRKYAGSPDSLDWFVSAVCAVLATVLLGIMVYRYPLSRLKMTGSRVPVIFVSVSSVCIITIGLIILFWNELDLQYDRGAIALSIMTLGLVQGTVTAIEWNRLGGRRGVWRILSIATATPMYLFAIALAYLAMTVQYGTS